jgi:NIMA (never in mitosis gene a)-related kinase
MDKYKVVRKLGQGSQSVVYLAHSVARPNEPLVLKRMASEAIRSSDLTALQRLRHDNLVPCLDAFQHEDQLVLVAPYYEGGDLERHLAALDKAKQRVPLEVAVRWVVQLARALQYCHEHKLIHRDLKPGNIYLSKDQRSVHLAGFSLAKSLDRTASVGSTLARAPVNLPPEVMGGEPFGVASDVWALGCLAYELVALRKPFSSPNFAQLVLRVCGGQFDPLPSDTPKYYATAVAGMLAVDPNQRWLLSEVVESDRAFITANKAEDAAAAAAAAGTGQQQSGAAADEEGDTDASVERLAASEELGQWVKWKMREFAQMHAALCRIGGVSSAANEAVSTPPPPPPVAPPVGAAMDPKRAQRMLPSPVKQPSLRPTGVANAGTPAAAAAAVGPSSRVAPAVPALPPKAPSAAALAAEAQRAELKQRMAEGRRQVAAAAPAPAADPPPRPVARSPAQAAPQSAQLSLREAIAQRRAAAKDTGGAGDFAVEIKVPQMRS